MAVGTGHAPITEFAQWYNGYAVNERTGALDVRGNAPCGDALWKRYDDFRREMDTRVANYHKLEMLADAEVISKKPDLPNISSGETAGIVRRIARNLVQHTPNLDVISKFDDDAPNGIFVRHILLSKIVGDDQYSNDMQQNLFASTKTAFTIGFDCVLPVLLQDAGGSWYVKYDSIHYRDVFPEPGAKDVREANEVFVRRYLTKADVIGLIRAQPVGWDVAALRALLASNPPNRQQESAAHADKKRGTIPEGYEVITWYSNTGDPFLTFGATSKTLLRIEKNKHPLKQHPVHFLVLEKDAQQPLGKSQVELVLGRQEFQDLMLNGAMKLWYRNINPSIIGYGAVNTIPNLSPGKYTQISNPNAKIEPFEVNTQTLLQYGQISQQNLGSMVQLVGAADQQMATQSQGNTGMSATPQGVEAQQAMVDITTNNYQKAIESFFSHYCSYALTVYFAELKGVKDVIPTADARRKLIGAGIAPEAFDEKGKFSIDFSELATEYWVRCVPGSLVELEDEKQMRVLGQLFVPLSQAMPALAAANDPEMLANAAHAMKFIIEQQIKLSGAAAAASISSIFRDGKTAESDVRAAEEAGLEAELGGAIAEIDRENAATGSLIAGLAEQVSLLAQTQAEMMQMLGGQMGMSAPQPNSYPEAPSEELAPAGTV